MSTKFSGIRQTSIFLNVSKNLYHTNKKQLFSSVYIKHCEIDTYIHAIQPIYSNF